MSRDRLLALLCVLLAVDIASRWFDRPRDGARLPGALAQAAAGATDRVAIATAQGPGNQPWVYVYDLESQRLLVYETGTQGIDLKGVRQLTWDLKIVELLPPCPRRLTVEDVKKILKI